LARSYGVWPAPSAADSPLAPTPPLTAVRPTAAANPVGTQTFLLGLGAALLIIAATVFAAVNWRRLGAIGQVAVLGGATIGLAAAAVRLRKRLAATAEALAIVAFGFALVDVGGAPKFGLVPKDWLHPNRPYLPFVGAILAAATVLAARRWRLRAWDWLGWFGVTAVAGLVVRLVGDALGGTPSSWAAAFGIMALTGVVLMCLPRGTSGHIDDQAAEFSGAASLFISGAAVGQLLLQHKALPGAMASTTATSFGLALAATLVPRRRRALGSAAGVLAAVTTALALNLPNDPQPVALGAATALVGGAALWAIGRRGNLVAGLVTAAAVWGTWAAERGSAWSADDRLSQGRPPLLITVGSIARLQLAWLVGLAAATLFAAALMPKGWAHPAADGDAARAPWLGTAWLNNERGLLDPRSLAWPAALLAEEAWLLASPAWAPHLSETWAWPLAACLLLAGVLATTAPPMRSLIRYGPALTVALIPSALATWGATWVTHRSGASTEHIVRLVVVLLAGTAGIIAGARQGRAGLFLPAAAAVAIAGAAQVFTSLDALPRWVALATVGAILLASGAHIEWLRHHTHTATAWLRHLT
jgi:hypothetical protein